MKYLGKISDIRIGKGGYDNAMFGITYVIENEHGTSIDFKGCWSHNPSENAKWTIKDRVSTLGEIFEELNTFMQEAKVTSVEKLVGTPVECYGSPSKVSSWRILTEVL
jgi:hypothetical protein